MPIRIEVSRIASAMLSLSPEPLRAPARPRQVVHDLIEIDPQFVIDQVPVRVETHDRLGDRQLDRRPDGSERSRGMARRMRR